MSWFRGSRSGDHRSSVPVEKRIDERLERRADLELAYPAERDEAKLQGLLADARVACRHADDWWLMSFAPACQVRAIRALASALQRWKARVSCARFARARFR